MPRPFQDMMRINLWITRKQNKALRQLAQEDGLNISELVRRGVDAYLLARTRMKERQTRQPVQEQD